MSEQPTSTTGVLGGRWRATVSPTGAVEPWDGSPALEWLVAADDRWHDPSAEPTVRQQRIDGTPVVETRIKVPSGDAVQRVWSVADHGGLTLVEVENDSTLPFAVAFTRRDVLTSRPPTDVPIQGIDLPPTSIVVPVGHHSSVTVALAHEHPRAGALPERLASPAQVARGWTTILDRAGRLVLPDAALVERIAWRRAELALNGPIDPADDPVRFLLDAGALVRLGEPAEPWVPEVAEAVAHAARRPRTWSVVAALDAAALVLHRADEPRALRDLAALQAPSADPLPAAAPDGFDLAWNELRLARAMGDGTAEVLAAGLPPSWLGANFEVHGLPIGADALLSYAVRWHGPRPAVLWEIDGAPTPLRSPVLAPAWSTAEAKGEALWPVPPGGDTGGAAGGTSSGDVSFS